MRKLKLALETLAVESFAVTSPAADRRGTVRGHYAGGDPDPVMEPDTTGSTDTWHQTCHTGAYHQSCKSNCFCVEASGGVLC